MTIDGKRIKIVSIVKPFKGMAKSELEQIEGRMVIDPPNDMEHFYTHYPRNKSTSHRNSPPRLLPP